MNLNKKKRTEVTNYLESIIPISTHIVTNRTSALQNRQTEKKLLERAIGQKSVLARKVVLVEKHLVVDLC
jgi:hypothetical protein